MAATLIEKKTGEFDPAEFHNRYVDALQEPDRREAEEEGREGHPGPGRRRAAAQGLERHRPDGGAEEEPRRRAAAPTTASGAKKPAAKKAPREESRRAREEDRPAASGRKRWRRRAASSTSRPTTASATSRRPRSRKGRKLKGKGDSFVVQKHDASRLHWDFRLELDGVLKSWAVPKGPSLDPDEKRLAMRTEDHPLDYGDFEGTIPKGEYGGGTVMLWDHGRWIPEPGKDPSKTIEEGHLHFTLEGERMKGEWVMFRLKPRPGEKAEPWMLKKVTDEFAEPDDGDALVDNCVTSVTTDRTMAEIASGTRRLALQPRRPEGRPRARRRRARRRRRSRSRSWRRWSTRCRPASTGSTNINMTATGC